MYSFVKVPLEEYGFREIQRKVVGREDYDNAKKAFADSISSLPGFVSLYEFGTLIDPELQDIDALVIVDGSENARQIEKIIRDKIAGKVERGIIRTLFDTTHILDVESFKKMPFFMGNENFSLIEGEKIQQEKLANPELFSAAVQIDRISKSFPREYMRLLWGKIRYFKKSEEFWDNLTDLLNIKKRNPSVDVLLCLRRLKSISTSIKIVKPENERTPKENEFIDSLAHLRANWRTIGDEEHNILLNLLNDAIFLSFALQEKVDQIIAPHISPEFEKPVFFRIHHSANIFLPDWTKEGAIEKTKKLYDNNLYFQLLPPRFAANMCQKKGIEFRGKISPEYKDVMEKRQSFIDTHAEFIKNAKLSPINSFDRMFDYGKTGLYTNFLSSLKMLKYRMVTH